MSSFTLHTTESAPAGAREKLAQIEKGRGFVPNMLRAMAESPAAGSNKTAPGVQSPDATVVRAGGIRIDPETHRVLMPPAGSRSRSIRSAISR